MARNRIDIDAPPSAVYAVLLDATQYPEWVVGAKEVRGIDRSWPRTGSRFHHTVGLPGVDIRDSTKIIDKKANRRVVLETRFRPAGVAGVTLDLKPKSRGRRTRVTMKEVPLRGPVRRWWSPALSLAVRARNAVALRRLRRLVASRAGRR